MVNIFSWNVNGIRAVSKKGFYTWLEKARPDILCIQETKAHPDQLGDELKNPPGYGSFWASAEKKGYSGTAVYYKKEPLDVGFLGIREFDCEGRGLIIKYPDFTIINAYFPNSQAEGARLGYKLDFCNSIMNIAERRINNGENILICGDYNIAHRAIDLANPKRNEKNPGYLPEERAWMEKFLTSGFSDTFRIFNKKPEQYTWWSYRFKARDRNIGWRIDYNCVNDNFANRVKKSIIHTTVTGSDHCPIEITIS